MAGGMDDRRRGLEEEYFQRKNREAIEKLRAKMKIAAEAKAAGTSSMACPRCDGALEERTFEDVVLDACQKCSGVWLDSIEFEQLLKSDKESWFTRLWDKVTT
jgi:hypothetical protein